MFKLVIADVVEFLVKFTLLDGKVNKTFSATLTAQRLSQSDITQRLEAGEFKYKDFMLSDGLVTDWAGQRLVLDEAGQPAPFGPDAFEVWLNVAGVAQRTFDAYSKACGAKEKN